MAIPDAPVAHDHVSASSIGDFRVKLRDIEPSLFPDITGLRQHQLAAASNESTEDRLTTSYETTIAISDLVKDGHQGAKATIQASWALLLYTFSEAETPSIVFAYHDGVADDYNLSVLDFGTSSPEAISVADVLAGFKQRDTVLQTPEADVDLRQKKIDTAITLNLNVSQVIGEDAKDALDASKFAVVLRVCSKGDNVSLKLSFSSAHLTETGAQALLVQFSSVLAYMLSAQPSSPYLNALDAIPKHLASILNDPPKPYSIEKGEAARLHDAFERHARDCSDKVALWFKKSLSDPEAQIKWSYRDLNARADGLSRVICRSLAVSEDEDGKGVVPICMEKSPELYVAILAVLKSGRAWCPIDPAFPAARKRDLLARSGGKTVLVSKGSELGECALPEDFGVIEVDEDGKADEHGRGVEQRAVNMKISGRTGKGDDIAYLIWTSGTTGLPKGVPISHWSAVQGIEALVEAIPWKSVDEPRVMQFSASTFDVSIMDLFYTWNIGGTLCSAPRDLIVGHFPELTKAFEATHANLTPAFMAAFPLSSCPTLKTVTSIGEKLPDSVADMWCAPDVISVNMYGPAEATIVSTFRQWTVNDPVKAHNVGVPLPTVSAFIVKGDMVLPRGAVGELALGGPHLASGYLNDPTKSSAKFVHHPRVGYVYLTGDMARVLADGTIEFVGRTDDLIKVGGIRIELSEISAALGRVHPEAREAATLLVQRKDRPQEVICTFIAVPSLEYSGAADVSPLAVEVALAAKDRALKNLPGYMIPKVFIILGRIPHTPSNKVDRKALVQAYANIDLNAWEITLSSVSKANVDVASDEGVELERKIAQVVREITGVSECALGPSTDLRAVGVDSICAIRLSSLLGKQGVDVAVVDVMQHPTIAGLARITRGRNHDFGDVEELLRAAVVELTGVSGDALQPTTNLAALGVDSIRAIRLCSILGHRGLQLSVVDVMQHRTIRELARVVSRRSSCGKSRSSATVEGLHRLDEFDAKWRPLVAERIEDVQRVLPCTPLQEGILSETLQNPRAYWAHHLLPLEPHVDATRLLQAWRVVTASTEALRAGFVPTARVVDSTNDAQLPPFFQLLYDRPKIQYTETDLDDTTEAAVQNIIVNVIERHAGSISPLWALTLLNGAKSQSLLVSIHHSIHDAVMLELVLRDVHAYYCGIPAIARPQLTEALATILPADPDASVDFWSYRLSRYADPDAPAVPELTASTLATDGFVSFCEPASADLSEAAKKLQCSLGDIVQAAWATVLAAYMETNRLVLGQTLSDRSSTSLLEHALGPLVSVLPVPVEFRPTTTGRELIKTLMQSQHESFPHRHIRLSKIRLILQRPVHQPLFPAMFVVHPDTEEGNIPLKSSRLWGDPRLFGVYVEHALALNVEMRKGGRIDLDLWGNSRVIAPAQLRLMVKQVGAIAAAIVKHPDEPLQSLHSGAAFQEDLLSVTRADPSPALREARDLHPTYWLEKHARENPSFLAVVVASEIEDWGAKTREWTYHELNEESNRIANFIRSAGIHSRCVGFSLPRTLESFAYMIGIFKSGNTYLPIEEDLPPARKMLLVEDSRAALVFTNTRHISSFQDPQNQATLINVDAVDHRVALEQHPVHLEKDEYDPDAPSYLLYTSGSTGMPKGVLVSYRNLSCFVEAFVGLIDEHCPTGSFAGQGRYLGRTSIAFDVHLLEIFGAFRMGMATASAPRSIILDDLGKTLQKLEITHCSLVPSLLERAELHPADVPALKWMSVGGEKISAWVIDTWAGEDSGVVLFNAYGPTEVTIGCSLARVTKTSSPRNIGRIFPNSSAFVLKPGSTELTLRGQPGELCVGGDLVALGYLNRPSAREFVNDYEGGRLYRTGDMVRLMADQTIEYLGRSDDQTKIRGQRLELAEVTEAVRTAAPARLAVVSLVARHSDSQRDWLLSFMATGMKRMGSEATVPPSIIRPDPALMGSIIAGCRQRLPAFMVPDLLLMLNYIPIAETSGKADSKVLRRLVAETPLSALLTSTNESDRSLTRTEEEISSVLLSTLDSGIIVKPSTRIFELGIDSLSAITLSFRLRAAGFNVTLPFLLGGPTVEEIAGKKGVQVTNSPPDAVPQSLDHNSVHRPRVKHLFPEGAIDRVYPAMPLQTSMVIKTLDSKVAAYVNHFIFEVYADDTDRLIDAIVATIREHDILRTCFVRVDDEILQVVLFPAKLPSPWSRHYVAVGALDALKRSLGDVSLDIKHALGRRPPLRLGLWREEGHSYLSLSIHHAIYDGESLMMFLEDVEDRYHKRAPSRRTPFSALLDHAAMQDESAAREFFSRYFHGLRLSPGIGVPEDETDHHSDDITMGLSSVQAAAKACGVTVHAVLQGAFAVSFGEHLAHDDIIFGVVLSGRTVPIEGAETILGPCFTTVPVRVQLRRATRLVDVAKEIQRNAATMNPYQHVSLRQIQKWISADRPLIDVLFSMNHTSEKTSSSNLWKQIADVFSIEYHLAVEADVGIEQNMLRLRSTYSSRFGQAAARNILVRMQELLQDPDVLLASERSLQERPLAFEVLPYLPEEETIRRVLSSTCAIPSEAIARDTSFLRLGLDSITSIRFTNALRRAGLNVRSSAIMTHASVARLARFCHSNAGDVDAEAAFLPSESSRILSKYSESIRRLSPEDRVIHAYPATPLQCAMLTSSLASGGKLYVVSHPLRLLPSTDIARLRAAWTRLVAKREIFRTTFHPGDEFPWIGAVHTDPPVEWVEHEGVEEERWPSSVSEFVASFINDQLDAYESPPICAHVLRASDGALFVPIMHHSLYDGLSLTHFLGDLARVYLREDPPERPDFSKAVPHLHTKNDLGLQLWQQSLQNYEPSYVASLLRKNDSPTQHAERKFTLSPAEMTEHCQRLEITPFSVAQFAWAVVLATVIRRGDVTFGCLVSGRSIPIDNCWDIAGPTFNTIPVRVVLPSGPITHAEALHAHRNAQTALQPYHHTPLAAIQAAFRRETGSDRLFDVLFVFQKTDESTAKGRCETLWETIELSGTEQEPEYPLNVEMQVSGDAAVLRAACRSGMMELDALLGILDSFDEILSNILKAPGDSLFAYSVSTAGAGSNPTGMQPVMGQHSPADQEVWNPEELQLREVLSEISGVPEEKIGRRTPMYAIGLDSIAAIQVANRCRKRGLSVSVVNILTGGHISGIFRERASEQALLQKASIATVSSDQVARGSDMRADEVELVLPVLSGQQYHLAAWLSCERKFYEPPFVYRFVSPADPERLAASWRSLRLRHSVLRTSFAFTGTGELVQVVHNDVPLHDKTYVLIQDDENLEEAVKRTICTEACISSDMFTVPVRARHVKAADGDAFVLIIHHALYDGWSIPLLMDDLYALYTGEPCASVPNFTRFVERVASGPKWVDRQYWSRTLDSPTVCVLPEMTESSSSSAFALVRGAVAGVSSLARRAQEHQVALSAFVLTCAARVVGELALTPDPIVGLFRAGRTSSFEGIERVAGPTLNLLPVRVRGATVSNPVIVAKRLQQDLNEMVAHEQAGLAEVLRAIGFANKPLFNVFLNLLWHADRVREKENEVLERWDIGVPTDFAPTQKLTGKTAIDGLDHSYIPKHALFVDIALDAQNDCIDIGVRSEGAVMGEPAIKEFIRRISAEINALSGGEM